MIHGFLLIDPSLGKADLSTLPPQVLLELFFSHFGDNHRIFYDAEGNLKDIHFDCSFQINKQDDLIGVNVVYRKLGGTACFEYLTSSTQKIDLSFNQLEGTINVTTFPSASLAVVLSWNTHSGPLFFRWCSKGSAVSRCESE